MASSVKQLSIFFLLTILLHTHARESQFFSKIPSTTNNDVVLTNTKAPSPQQQQEEPNFLPESENGYGLYGHESGQLPPSTTTTTPAYGQPTTTTTTTGDVQPFTTNGQPATTSTPLYNTESAQPTHQYLPKNYNPVAYVTEPEDINDSAKLAEEKNNYNGEQNYDNTQQEDSEFRSSFPTSENNNYNGGSLNSQPQGLSDTSFSTGAALNSRENDFNTGEAFRPQPQGMSDTRFLENGKYHYDINTGKYNSNHPYESLKARNEFINGNTFGNSENGLGFNGENAIGGYQQNQDELRFEENNMP